MCPKKLDEDKVSKVKRGTIRIKPGSPIDISELENDPSLDTEEIRPEFRQIGETIKRYLSAVKSLMEGKYAHLSELVPIHMTEACDLPLL